MTSIDRAPSAHNARGTALYIALDLGNTFWHVALGDGAHHRLISIDARDLKSLRLEIRSAKKRFNLPANAPIRSCFEAGRDGFWLHRQLESDGVRNLVVDSASIETTRHAKRPKTDRIDARKLLRKLIQYHGGDNDVFSVLHIPTRDQEQERRTMRHRAQLQKELVAHTTRIRSLLVLHGVAIDKVTDEQLRAGIQLAHLGPIEQQELQFAFARLKLVREQFEQIEQQVRARVQQPRACTPRRNTAAPADPAYACELERKARSLTRLKAIGATSAWTLASEFFWRDFNNRREVGAAAGLTDVPHNSGSMDTERGISKAGSGKIRELMVELSWLWIRWQPRSKLTQWYNLRWATAKRRKKVGIVAVARRLLIDLWRYLEHGVVPEGAILKDATPEAA